MLGHKILISVKDRWIKTGEFDSYGLEIKRVNPNPTVVVHCGIWSRKEGQHVHTAMTSKEFGRLTGHTIYGGSIEPRGTHYIRLSDRGREALKELLVSRKRAAGRVKDVVQVPRVKCIIRRKSK